MTTPCDSLTADTWGGIYLCVQANITEAIGARQTLLIPEGQDLAGALLLITMSVTVLFWALSGDAGTAITDALRTFLRYGVVAVLLAGWQPIVGDFFGGSVNQIAQKLTGIDGVGTAVQTMSESAIMILKEEEAVRKCYKAPGGIEPSSQTSYPEETFCDQVSAKPGNPVTGWEMLLQFPRFLFGKLLELVAVLFLGFMVVGYLLAIFMAQIMFGIGMMLGPILIPFLVWEKTEWLWDGWLRFMTTAAITKITTAIMVVFVSGVIGGARSMAKFVAASGVTVDLLPTWVMVIICAVGAFMMWQIQGIAQALTSGGAGVTSQKFGQGTFSKNAQSHLMNAMQRFMSGSESGKNDGGKKQ